MQKVFFPLVCGIRNLLDASSDSNEKWKSSNTYMNSVEEVHVVVITARVFEQKICFSFSLSLSFFVRFPFFSSLLNTNIIHTESCNC